MILVDSNVLIDVVGNDPLWNSWSKSQLAEGGSRDRLVINPVIIAEVAPRSGSFEQFWSDMAILDIDYEELTGEAAFAAGKAFVAYRQNKGPIKSVLPDFFVGGHALEAGAQVLTRDPRFYRTYFPTVPLITPEES